MMQQKLIHLTGFVLVMWLPGLPVLAECPSIREIDWARYLSDRVIPNPDDCGMDLGPDNLPVDLKSVDYADLDGEPGEEVVVRAQTCFFFSGGADISEVLKLSCSEDGEWTLAEIPVESVPCEIGPGRPRYAAKLYTDGSTLKSWVSLYRPTDINVEATWNRDVTYVLIDGVFKIRSIEIGGPRL